MSALLIGLLSVGCTDDLFNADFYDGTHLPPLVAEARLKVAMATVVKLDC